MAANVNNAIKGYPKVRFASDADQYEFIGAGNNSVAGPIGRQGDYVESILAVVTNNLNCAVTIQDGGDAAITVLPNNINPGNGAVYIPLGISSRNNNWLISCAAGVSALVRGVW